MRRGPTLTPGVPLRTVMIVLAEDPRQNFMGGGLTGSNISMQPPAATWQLLEGGVSHALFHLWNGRSFRNRTPAEAWFAEGVTEYYAFNALRHAGTITDAQWRANLREADQLYRRDTGIGQMSITDAGAQKFAHRGLTYAAGYLVAACLDAHLRQRTSRRARASTTWSERYSSGSTPPTAPMTPAPSSGS